MSVLQQLEQLTKQPQQNPTKLQELESQIAMTEFELIKKGLFSNDKVSQNVLKDAALFYELIFFANIVTNQFALNLDIYSKLSVVYHQQQQLTPQSLQVISLHMMYLISMDRMKDYHGLYESLNEQEKNLKEIKQIESFSNCLNIGNYIQAQKEVKELSMYHEILLGNIQKARKVDLCKIVNLCNEDLSMEDIKNLFGIQNQNEMNELVQQTNQLFEKNKIDWKIVENIIYRRKKEQSSLNPNEVIEDMVSLVRQIEKIFQFI